MAARVSALRRSAVSAGEQLGERASKLYGEAQARHLTTYALAAVSGLAVGMLVGLLFAPASGYETRHRLSDRASGAIEGAGEMARRRAKQLSERAQEIA